MEPTDRRRIGLATVLTVVALPAIWMLGAKGDDAHPALGAAGAPQIQSQAATSDTYQSPLPVFLNGKPLALPPSQVDVAVPPAGSANDKPGTASYRWIGRSTCWSALAPSGTVVTVTNVANRQSIRCTSSAATTPAGVDIVLDTNAFATIADLADSPIHVRVTW